MEREGEGLSVCISERVINEPNNNISGWEIVQLLSNPICIVTLTSISFFLRFGYRIICWCGRGLITLQETKN